MLKNKIEVVFKHYIITISIHIIILDVITYTTVS